MYTVATKSLLAKLMATENIRVEHRSACKGPYFDLEKRLLVCPIWKDMSGDLYDLIMGHEISHALNTPTKGWNDAVECAGGKEKVSERVKSAYHGFLNTIEDARIEKHVKRLYPGLRAPMIRGYKDLLARDFFHLSAVSDYNSLYLINKLNLVAKCGAQLGITFTPEQQPFYDEMLKMETWEEALALTNKLWAFSKMEQKIGEREKKAKKQEIDKKKQEERKKRQEEREKEEAEEEDSGVDGEGEGEETEEDEVGQGKTAEELDEEESEGEDSEGDAEEDSTGNGKETGGDSEPEKPEEFVPTASTDEAFRKAQKSLVDDGTVKSVYMTIPTPNLKDIVVPASKVNEGMNKHWKDDRARYNHSAELLKDFKERNDPYVGLLAQEFEQRKAAKTYNKSKVSESGDININKLASYRLDDNMFKKLTIAYKGKSHGLILLLDRSSSMRDMVRGATEQLLVLAMFCRKVNIPFAAYTFTTPGYGVFDHDFEGRTGTYSKNPLNQFSKNDGDLATFKLSFREILNSNMQGAEFNNSMMNQLQLANAFSHSGRVNAPNHESMSSTPLNEAIIVVRDLVRLFQRKYHLDLVNTVIVHDGDSNHNYAFHTTDRKVEQEDRYGWEDSNIDEDQRFRTGKDRVTIHDVKAKQSFDCPQSDRGLTIALLNWLQATTGCGVFGFYVCPGDIDDALGKMYTNKDGIELGAFDKYSLIVGDSRTIMIEGLRQKLNTEKFLESFTKGFTRFFFLPGGQDQLRIHTGTMQLEGRAKKWNVERLEVAFRKVSQKQFVSRVLVTRFIDLIAKH